MQATESWAGPGNEAKVNWKSFYSINASESVVVMVNFSFLFIQESAEEETKYLSGQKQTNVQLCT